MRSSRPRSTGCRATSCVNRPNMSARQRLLCLWDEVAASGTGSANLLRPTVRSITLLLSAQFSEDRQGQARSAS